MGKYMTSTPEGIIYLACNKYASDRGKRLVSLPEQLYGYGMIIFDFFPNYNSRKKTKDISYYDANGYAVVTISLVEQFIKIIDNYDAPR